MLRIILVLCLVILPLSALAESDDSDYGRAGFYVGISGVAGIPVSIEDRYDKALEDRYGGVDGIDFSGRAGTAIGVGVRAGYRIHSRVAVEAQFQWLPGFSYKIDDNQRLVSGDVLFPVANARVYIVPEGPFQAYLLGGVGYLRANYEFSEGNINSGNPSEDPVYVSVGPLGEYTDEDFAAQVGGGFEAYFTRSMGACVEVRYVAPIGDAKDFDHVAVDFGLFYRF